jgi:hypothetical protein
MQVVAPADVLIIDEDLGNGATAIAAAGSHRIPRLLIAINGVFGVRDTLSIQQILGTNAEGASAPGVNLDFGHKTILSGRAPALKEQLQQGLTGPEALAWQDEDVQNGACGDSERKVKNWWLSGRLLALLAGVVLAGGLASALDRERRISGQRTAELLETQRLAIERDTRRFDANLRLAEQSALRFAERLSYRSTALPARGVDLQASLERGPDGSLRSRRDRFQSRREAGLLLPAGTLLTPETQRFLAHARDVTRAIGQENRPGLVANSWALPHGPGLVLYGPGSPAVLFHPGALPEAKKKARLAYSSPSRSPDGQARWTPPTYDPAARKWVISVVAPFFRDGRWAGAVGHDLMLNRLLANLKPPRAGSAAPLARALYLADGEGRLLTGPYGLRSREQRLPERYRPLLEQARHSQTAQVFASGTDPVVVAPIPTLSAYAVYRVDGEALRERFQGDMAHLRVPRHLLLAGLVGGSIVWLWRERPTHS